MKKRGQRPDNALAHICRLIKWQYISHFNELLKLGKESITFITIRNAYFLSYFKIKWFESQSNKKTLQVAKKCHISTDTCGHWCAFLMLSCGNTKTET